MGIAYNPRIVTDGLVLALDAGNPKSYPGSGTTWTDLSGNGNNGTLVNGPTYSSSSGGYIEFDGTDDDCDLSSTPPINGNEITFSVWNYGIEVKSSSIIWLSGSSGVRMLQVHLPWGNSIVYFDAGNGVSTYDRVQKVVSASEYQGWHHWTFTKNATNGTMSIYLDNSLWYSQSGLTLPIGIPDTIRSIGSAGSGNYHRGYISNLQLYNRELSLQEIQQNFNATRSRFSI